MSLVLIVYEYKNESELKSNYSVSNTYECSQKRCSRLYHNDPPCKQWFTMIYMFIQFNLSFYLFSMYIFTLYDYDNECSTKETFLQYFLDVLKRKSRKTWRKHLLIYKSKAKLKVFALEMLVYILHEYWQRTSP